MLSSRKGQFYVDMMLTPELEAEGDPAREIMRRSQDMRKEIDLRVEDKIRAVVDIESKPILDLAMQKKEHIANEVRAAEFEMGLGLELKGKLVKDWDIEGVCVRIGIDLIKVGGVYNMSTKAIRWMHPFLSGSKAFT